MITPDREQPERKRVIYTGHVQGVCFRMTAVDIAQGRPVVGYVRNLRDGSVELEAEGAADAVQAFLGAVEQHFSGHIRGASITAVAARGDEDTFEIRY